MVTIANFKSESESLNEMIWHVIGSLLTKLVHLLF